MHFMRTLKAGCSAVAALTLQARADVLSDLKAQIAADVDQARRILAAFIRL